MDKILTSLKAATSRASAISSPATLAVTLQRPWSIENNKWVQDKDSVNREEYKQQLWDTNQSYPGIEYCFFDTVVVSVPCVTLRRGKEQWQPRDATYTTNVVTKHFGVSATINGCNAVSQQYRLSTSNIHPLECWEKIQQVVRGELLADVDGVLLPVQIVKVDITTNIAATVIPETYLDKVGRPNKLTDMGWEVMQNDEGTGYSCHSYAINPSRQTKVYNKLAFMLETSSVETGFGCNLKYLLDSPQRNIKQGFRSPLFHKQGFSRVETRVWLADIPETLQELVEEHLEYVEDLWLEHTRVTSLSYQWDNLLSSGHTQVAVIVKDTVTGECRGAISRWSNAFTGRGNGDAWDWSMDTKEAMEKYILYRTIGKYPINVYYFEQDGKKSKQVNLVAKGTLVADTNHRGNIFCNVKNRAIQANGVGVEWLEVGIPNLPFLTKGYNDNPRTIRVFGDTYLPDVIETTKQVSSSEKRAQKLAKVKEEKLNKANADKWTKIQQQVELDKRAKCPSWQKVNHISELAAIKVPLVTKYEANTTQFGDYAVKVGKKWYRANSKLGGILEYQQPTVPFLCYVTWDGKEYKGNKVYDIRIEQCPEEPVFKFD